MKLFAGILVFTSCLPYLVWCGSPPTVTSSVDCVCPLVYSPVCGSNGITYSNECMLNCANVESTQRREATIFPLYPGPCKRFTCNCKNEYKPVCGTDQQTYTNECWFNCINQIRKNDKVATVGLAHRSACLKFTCKCSNSIVPICGTDGKTYRNDCIMQCYSRLNAVQKKPPILYRASGPCRIEKCSCSNNKDELCATDNNTYYNRCFLDCQNRKLDQLDEKPLTAQYRGPCNPCACPKILDPVCANNDVTFDNKCLLECENEKRVAAGAPKLLERWDSDCNCGCNNTWDPWCGSDGHTYTNICWFKCKNNKRIQDKTKPLTTKGRGVCQQCHCDYCSQVEESVCDSEGNIHRNTCYFYCNSDCRAKSGLKRLSIHKCSRTLKFISR